MLVVLWEGSHTATGPTPMGARLDPCCYHIWYINSPETGLCWGSHHHPVHLQHWGASVPKEDAWMLHCNVLQGWYVLLQWVTACAFHSEDPSSTLPSISHRGMHSQRSFSPHRAFPRVSEAMVALSARWTVSQALLCPLSMPSKRRRRGGCRSWPAGAGRTSCPRAACTALRTSCAVITELALL